MSRILLSLFACLTILASLPGLVFQPDSSSSQSVFTIPELIPSWITGVKGVIQRIIVVDLDQDGKTEIISCASGHIYALNRTPAGSYEPIWYSQNFNCLNITSADRDHNGVLEFYVKTFDGKVVVVNSIDRQPLGNLNLPSGLWAYELDVADVDGDGSEEIVVVTPEATLVYDAVTFALEWQAMGLGGKEVAAGNFDSDPQVEIIVNGDTAHILNASQKTEEWAYSGGFGFDMDACDVDGDGRIELATYGLGYFKGEFHVFEGDTKESKWSTPVPNSLGSSIAVSDVNGDGFCEVLISKAGLSRGLYAYQGTDGTPLWDISHPDGSDVVFVGSGDVNNDGVNEILWQADRATFGTDVLQVVNWVNKTIEWSGDSLDGPIYVAAGDVDLDGRGEIITASQSTNSGYGGGTLKIYDGASHQLEWSTVVNPSYYDVFQLAIGQLDGDAALEILVGGDNWYKTRLKAYDGITHEIDWISADLGSGAPKALVVMDLDADGVDEVIVGLGNSGYGFSDNRVQVMHGISNVIQWDSGALDNLIRDLSVGDLDGDGSLDLAVLTHQSVYVFNVDNWSLKLNKPLVGGTQIAITNGDLQGAGDLLVITSGDNLGYTLQAWDGVTYAAKWQRFLGNNQINELSATDVDADGTQEFIVMSNNVRIGNYDYPYFWEYQKAEDWRGVNNMALFDVDQDGQEEFLWGSSAFIQVNEMTPTTVTIQNAYLPIVERQRLPRGLYGTVTENGIPVAGESLDLRFYNGETWSTIAVSTTASNGTYSFTGIPNLNAGQYYYVRYQNMNHNPNRLWTWHTQSISSYISGGEIHSGDFDLANITLLYPTHNASVPLPFTFEWTTRSAAPSDSYELNLFDPYDEIPYFYTNPPLGYVGAYNLSGLPSGFSTGVDYAWDIWVYSPDGGFGVSYDAYVVRFTNAGLNIQKSAQPTQSKNSQDLEARQKK